MRQCGRDGEGVCVAERVVGFDCGSLEYPFRCREVKGQAGCDLGDASSGRIRADSPLEHIGNLAQVDPAHQRPLASEEPAEP